MPICAVRTCGERGQFACKKSEGQIISFHRFPSDQYPLIKAKWIRATGQRKITYSWQPTKESTICSKHFKKEDFLTCTDLKISAVPISEEPSLDDHNEHLQMPSHEAEKFEPITDAQYLGEMRKLTKELLDGFMEDSVDNSDTDSADEIIELPQCNQIIRNKESIREGKDIPIEYEPPTFASRHDQSESNQPIAIQDSEPEFSETSSELEFTELESSETKSSQLSVDAIEDPQGSEEQPPYGMKISKAYSTRKRLIVQTKDQMKTNIKMYRIDPFTKSVLLVKSIPKDSLLTEKPIYIIKKPAASLAGNSQLNQNSSFQFANNTAEIISPETGSSINRVITLSLHKEERKRVYSTPVPKLAQINQKVPANKADIAQKIWKATKLNPTMETAGRVKKHQKLKVNSIIKKISPSGKRPQLPLASSKASKPKPTTSRLTTSVTTPADSMLTSTVSTPTSTVSTPSPAYSLPTRADSSPTPTPAKSMLTSTVSTPTVSTPSPAYSMPTSADSMAIPANSTPPLAGSMLTPANTKPIPADSRITSADLTVTPADSTLTRADLLEMLADSTQPPADLMPTPSEAMPIPADSTPPLGDSMPTQGEATPIPTDSMPTPAVLSPHVQKLNDSNIHTPDEYDTFAKHVATQLRQLSLESYLSAQGEIQSVLSKYRLCDLDAIKKKTMIDL